MPAACFAPYTHSGSGITSWVLRAPAAVSTQSLYFGKPSTADDLRVLWFAWFTPWAGLASAGRMLGFVDMDSGTVTWLPDHQFADGGAAVDPATGDVIWASGRHVWRRAADASAMPRRLGSLPYEMVKGRLLKRLVTQPSVSADGSRLLLDTRIGLRCFLGAIDLAEGTYEPWFSSKGHFNHAQFSPGDPDVALIAAEDEADESTGILRRYTQRMFLYHRDGHFHPVGPGGRKVGHEVWGASGRSIWFIDFTQGVMRLDITTGESELVWPRNGWHAHASACERYVVCDHRSSSKQGVAFYVLRFLNRVTGKSIQFARMAIPEDDEQHQHPHPRFCAGDAAIVYTMQMDGRAAVAIAATADLIAATG